MDRGQLENAEALVSFYSTAVEAQIDRRTSVRHFEIPHLRSSAVSSTRSSRSAIGDKLGGHRLQLKTHDERARTIAFGCRAGPSLNCLAMLSLHSRTLRRQKHKSDVPELETPPLLSNHLLVS